MQKCFPTQTKRDGVQDLGLLTLPLLLNIDSVNGREPGEVGLSRYGKHDLLPKTFFLMNISYLPLIMRFFPP